MSITVERIANVHLVRLDAPIFDALAAREWSERLTSEAASASSIVLDLSRLHYVDWFGLNALLRAVRHCPGKVRFAALTTSLQSMFDLAGLDRFLEIHSSVEAALAAAGIQETP